MLSGVGDRAIAVGGVMGFAVAGAAGEDSLFSLFSGKSNPKSSSISRK